MSVQIPMFDTADLKPSRPTGRDGESVGGRFDLKKFVDNFEVRAEGSSGVGRLRGFVLDLAARGLLVPQKPGEGPAHDLLVKLGGSRTETAVSPVFELPASWCWTTVGCVCSYVQRGKSPRYVEVSSVPVVSQKCVQWEGFLMDRARFIDPASLNAYAEERFLQDGDLLWNSTGHGTVGRIAVFRADSRYRQVVADSHVTVLRSQIDPRFLWCWIASPTVQVTIDDLVSGTTKQTELATSTVIAQVVPLPPLAEQQRIVAKVDELMRLLDELEAKQAKKREVQARLRTASLDALTSAEAPEEFKAAWKRVEGNFGVLFDAPSSVGLLRQEIIELAMRGRVTKTLPSDEPTAQLVNRINKEVTQQAGKVSATAPLGEDVPFQIPASWRWVRWGSLTLGTSSGWSPQCEGGPRQGNEWGVLKVSAVSWFVFKPEENKALPKGLQPRPEFAARSGDFLMSRANTAELVGRSVIVDGSPERLILSDKLVRCEFSPSVEKRFVNLFNRTAAARAHYLTHASGTSDSMKNISREVILSMPVPLPPLPEQKRIVAKVEQLMKLCDELEMKLKRAEEVAAQLVEAVVAEMVA